MEFQGINSLKNLNSNVLKMSKISENLSFRPLSEIQNSIQKFKLKKLKGQNQRAYSRQNSIQYEKFRQKKISISSQNNLPLYNIASPRSQQYFVETLSQRQSSTLNKYINSILGSTENNFGSNSNKRQFIDKGATQSKGNSYENSEYQLLNRNQCCRKSVRFNDKQIQTDEPYLNLKSIDSQKNGKIQSPSILKIKLSANSANSSRQNSARSMKQSSLAKGFVETQNNNFNKLIKAKYEALIKKYEQANRIFNKSQIKNYQRLQKYTDSIFLPEQSSIFTTSIYSKVIKPKPKIMWKRIPQLFSKNQKLIIVRKQNTKSLIKITKKDLKTDLSLAEDYFVTCLNCIRQNKVLLDRMFQIKQINFYGIYLVKIFLQNCWKYVIIDDLIPVIDDEQRQTLFPAFLYVEKAESNFTDTIQIWPYLLEKAYAVFYSKYQALKYGTEVDFLAELTGTSYKKLNVKQLDSKLKFTPKIEALLSEEKAIILGQKVINDKSIFLCVLPDLNSITKKSLNFCTILTKEKSYKPVKQKIQTFFATSSYVYVYELQVYQNFYLSYLCPDTEAKKRNLNNFQSPLPSGLNQFQEKQKQRKNCSISMKFFIIEQMTNGILCIKQKDCRFYFQSKFQYKYIWIRAILLLKQHNGGYRWIDGQYSNSKMLIFHLRLQPGEYYLLLMPQWNLSYKYKATITLHTDRNTVPIQKRSYLASQQIFQKGCADIAQRQGTLNQINKFICSYNYVSAKVGLIIENINNQSQVRPATVLRSISGLKCEVALVPVNKQFYYITNSDYDQEPVKKTKKVVEVEIQPNQHFTVVLKTLGGIDHQFFQTFGFGS